MHVYIVPEPGKPVLRHCTVLLSLTQTCFYNLTSQGSIQCMLPLKTQSINRTRSHHVLSGSHFYGWVNQSPNDSTAAPGASKLWLFGYESYPLTNCTITACVCVCVCIYIYIYIYIYIHTYLWLGYLHSKYIYLSNYQGFVFTGYIQRYINLAYYYYKRTILQWAAACYNILCFKHSRRPHLWQHCICCIFFWPTFAARVKN